MNILKSILKILLVVLIIWIPQLTIGTKTALLVGLALLVNILANGKAIRRIEIKLGIPHELSISDFEAIKRDRKK